MLRLIDVAASHSGLRATGGSPPKRKNPRRAVRTRYIGQLVSTLSDEFVFWDESTNESLCSDRRNR
jgi:hypothetical protein